MSWLPWRKKKSNQPERVKIVDVTDDSFKQQVLQRSHKHPVLVDFWAAWCVPCRQLGPTLERLAVEADSPFVLAKLNTEYHRRTAERYQIRSIPAVKMFRNGQVVGEFTGALPETAVRQFVEKTISTPPPTTQIKIGANSGKRLDKAIYYLKKGKGFEALMQLHDFPEGKQSEKANRLTPLARFLCDMDDGDGLTGHNRLDGLHLDAVDAWEQGDQAAALEHLLAARQLKGITPLPQTQAAAEGIFALLGPRHQLTQSYQEQFK